MAASHERLTFSAHQLLAASVHPEVTLHVDMRDGFDWARMLECVNGMSRAISPALGKSTLTDTRKTYIGYATQAANERGMNYLADSSEYDKLRVAIGKKSRAFLFDTRDQLCVLCTQHNGLFLFVNTLDGGVACAAHVTPGNSTFACQFTCVTTGTVCLLNALVHLLSSCYAAFSEPAAVVYVDAGEMPADVHAIMGEFASTFMALMTGSAPVESAAPASVPKRKRARASPAAALQQAFLPLPEDAAVLPAPAWTAAVLQDVAAFVREHGLSADWVHSATAHICRFTPVADYDVLTTPVGTPTDDAVLEAALLRLLNVAQNVHFTRADLCVWQELARGSA